MKYLIILLLALSSLSIACRWVGDPTGGVPYEKRVNDYIKDADYIFLGRIEVYEWKPNPEWEHNNPWHYHRIIPVEQYKGTIENSIEYWPATSCHKVFSKIGEKFVLFGYEQEGSIQFPMISGSISFERAIEMGLLDQLRSLVENSSNNGLNRTPESSAAAKPGESGGGAD